MAYTTIDDPTTFFNTILYTGNSTDDRTVTGVGFQPNWVWIKDRSNARVHYLADKVRGDSKYLQSQATTAEITSSSALKSIDSDGFTTGTSTTVNSNGETYVAWNWKAGGTAPAITYSVKVVSDSGNKYRFDDFGTSAVTLDLQEGGTYTFDQSDSSNAGHPLRFSTTSDGSHGGGSEYTTGVTTTGTPGSAGAKTIITISASAPTLYYYCTQHSGMGGQANTNSTFGSSNFSGSIQANVSANTTAGFSIVSYTGTGSNATIGHGLGVTPKWIIVKQRNATRSWEVFHSSIPSMNTKYIELNTTAAASTYSPVWGGTDPTSTTFHVGTDNSTNNNSGSFIAYCFAEKKGYSKFGSYTGNGSTDGTFIYTGFRPAWFMYKSTSSVQNWIIQDNKRANSFNEINADFRANVSDAENTNTSYNDIDFLSNGIKLREDNNDQNQSGGTYIYMAFAESPFVNSNGVPTNAR